MIRWILNRFRRWRIRRIWNQLPEGHRQSFRMLGMTPEDLERLIEDDQGRVD